MRIAACIVGIVGALCGIFFAQLVVSVGMMLAIVTSATQGSEMTLGTEFYMGLGSLVIYAIAFAGAVVVGTRPIVGGTLLLLGAVGSLVTTFVINGSPTESGGGAFIANVFPYLGPVLLFVATGLAAFDLRRGIDETEFASAPLTAVPMAPRVVEPSPAHLASAVAMPLLAQPAANAARTAEIAPGTAFESYEQEGEFVHVRGDDFEGYLPAWSVRRKAS